MAYFKWIPELVAVVREDIMNLWDAWGIQMLVIGSTSFQAVLLFGNHRRYVTGRAGILMRMFFWVIYLFATEVVPYSLGKLTGLRVINPVHPDPNIELKAFLAPLLLLQLGYPDNITAYSMEDNQLGWRQVLNMVIVVAVVIGILIRCWSYSSFVFLYFPMFVAGIVKYMEGVWALKFALGSNISTTKKESAPKIPGFLGDLPEETQDLKLLVKAYYRFHCLKPHEEDWIYHPHYVSGPQLSIDQSSFEDAFKVTEMELGFMYDVLYTKAPIIYTKPGLIVRFVSFFSLFVTLCAFRILARTLPQDVSAYTNFTFSVLTVTFLIEMYQILRLPFSDWAIVKMAKRHKWPLMLPFLRCLATRSAKQCRRWSNKLDQFNLLTYCLQDDWTRDITFLKCFGIQGCRIQEYIQKNWRLNRMGPVCLPLSEKVKLLEKLQSSEIRASHRFSQGAEFRWIVEKGFDKRIVVWHIATNICYHQSNDSFRFSKLSKLISGYMVYLLAIHRNMLSIITGDIVFAHACSEIKSILEDEASIETEADLARTILARPPSPSLGQDPNDATTTSQWDVISDSKSLAELLLRRADKWEVIESFWMELLFSAAKNCQLSHHADQLRRGGELITLIWLILAHKTDNTLAS